MLSESDNGSISPIWDSEILQSSTVNTLETGSRESFLTGNNVRTTEKKYPF